MQNSQTLTVQQLEEKLKLAFEEGARCMYNNTNLELTESGYEIFMDKEQIQIQMEDYIRKNI